MTEIIRKAGLLVVREGRLLLCRKNRDTALLILPGGKIEAEETAEQCIHREIAEELGSVAGVHDLQYVGTYQDVAAGAANRLVEIQLYQGWLSGTLEPQSEIKELIWFSPQDDVAMLAPSIARKILPDLLARGLLSSR